MRFWERLYGVGWRVRWSTFEVLHLPQCRMVHCFGLKRPIDIVFTSTEGAVLDIRAQVRPWRVVFCLDAQDVWELPAGASREWGIVTATQLSVVHARAGNGVVGIVGETPHASNRTDSDLE